MAINYDAQSKGRQLDAFSAMQTATGVDEKLTSAPVIDAQMQPIEPAQQPLQVAGGSFRKQLLEQAIKSYDKVTDPVGDIIGRLLNPSGGLLKTQQKLRTVKQQGFKVEKLQPDHPNYDEVQPWAVLDRANVIQSTHVNQNQANIARLKMAGIEEPPKPKAVKAEKINIPIVDRPLSEATMDAQVKEMGMLRVDDGQVDAALRATIEPKRTELLSDGMIDFRAVGEGGDQKIPDEGSVLSLINQISINTKINVDEATRGVVEQETTKELAEFLGTSPNKLKEAILQMEVGGVPIVQGAGLSETMLAVRNLVYSEQAKLDQLAEIAKKEPSDEAILNFRQQLDLVQNLQVRAKGAQTEIARTLAQYRIPVSENPNVRDMDLTNLLQEKGGRQDNLELLESYLALPEGRDRANFARKVGRHFSNSLYEIWINALLSSPVTHVKNITGAFLTTFAEIPVGFAGATVGTVRRTMGGEGGMTFGDAYARMYGQIMAMQEAWGAAGKSFQTGEAFITGSKLMDTQRGQAGRREPYIRKETWGKTGVAGFAIDALGNALTLGGLPTRLLEFEDTWFKVVAQRGSLYEQGFRASREQNLKGDDASNFIANFVADPPPQALEEANDTARNVTLQSPLDHEPGKSIHNLARLKGMRWFIPFLRTPYNALRFSFEHTPLAPFTKNYKDAMSGNDPVKKDIARARVALGSSAMATVGAMAASGQITGNGPNNRGERIALQRQGWRPYSIKVGNNYYSYAGAEPYSTLIGIVADSVEIAQSGLGDQDDLEEIVTGVAFAFAKNLTNKTFMQGFSNLISSMQDPGRYAGKTVDSFVRSANPAFLRLINRNIDPTKRQTDLYQSMPKDFKGMDLSAYPEFADRYPEVLYLKNLLNTFKSSVPGWSETLPPTYDLWGRPKIFDGAFGPNFISPIYQSKFEPVLSKKGNNIDEEMGRLRISSYEHPNNPQGFPLTPDELAFYQQRAGQYALELVGKQIDSSKYQKRKQLGESQRFDSHTNDILKNVLQKQIRQAREMAYRDLRKDKKFGTNIRRTEKQYQKILREAQKRSMGR